MDPAYRSYGRRNSTSDNRSADEVNKNNHEQPISSAQFDVLVSELKTLKNQNGRLVQEHAQLRNNFIVFQQETRAMFNTIVTTMNKALSSPGEVTRTYAAGIYTGEFKDGLRHGKGRFEAFNGDRYSGIWEDDHIKKGTLEDSEGTFVGEFDSKGETSRGRFTYKDNSWFEGSWWGHKERWIGTFCDGVVKMEGTYNPVSGQKNSFHGNVTCSWVDESNGSVSYKGGWYFGKPDGQGAYTMICKNGISHTWRGPWVYTKTPPSPPENNRYSSSLD